MKDNFVIGAIQKLGGQDFDHFWLPTYLNVDIFYLKRGQKEIFLTTYPPHLVNIVFEWPHTRSSTPRNLGQKDSKENLCFSYHTTCSWNIKWQKCAGMGLNGFVKINENSSLIRKKSLELFRSCLLNSRANLAHFHPNWAGLAVLFSR